MIFWLTWHRDEFETIFSTITGGWSSVAGFLYRGHDMAVDANGNPHMFVRIPRCWYYTNRWYTSGDFVYYLKVNLLVDVYTTDGGLT